MSGEPEARGRAGLVIASDRAASGQRRDETEAALRRRLAGEPFELEPAVIVSDDEEALALAIRKLAGRCALVLTSGGTGIGARDRTVDATRRVLDRELPGFGEAMRAAGRDRLPTAILSRATAGTCGGALVVNLPGSPDGAVECLAAVLPAVPHALRLLAGSVRDCGDDLGRNR
jgi:molybdenum cofactor synthesis domain-containing protein